MKFIIVHQIGLRNLFFFLSFDRLNPPLKAQNQHGKNIYLDFVLFYGNCSLRNINVCTKAMYNLAKPCTIGS